jgi:hypothetical protein
MNKDRDTACPVPKPEALINPTNKLVDNSLVVLPKRTDSDSDISSSAYDSESDGIISEIDRLTDVLTERLSAERVPHGIMDFINAAQVKVSRALIFKNKNITLSSERSTDDNRASLYEWMMHVGVGLCIRNLDNQVEASMSRLGVGQVLRDTRTVANFYHTPEIALELDGYSLSRLYDEDGKKKQVNLAGRFEFLMMAMDKNSNPNLTYGVLPEKYPELAKEGKDMTKKATDAFVTIALLTDSPEVFFSDCLTQDHSGKEYFEFANVIVKRIQQTRELLTEAILNPLSPDHTAIKSIVEKYLMVDDPEKANYIFDLFTLADFNDVWIKKLYRSVESFSRSGPDEDFYNLFANLLLGYAEKYYDFNSLDDVDELVKDGVMFEKDGDISDFKVTINHIVGRTREIRHEVNIGGLSDGLITRPRSLQIIFDKNRPTKFTIEMKFREGEDADINVEVEIDSNPKCGNPQIEWSLLESPDDPQMAEFRAGITEIAKKSLDLIREKVDAEYEEKHKAKTTIVFQPKINDQIRNTCRPEPEPEAINKKRKRDGKRDFSQDGLLNEQIEGLLFPVGDEVESTRKNFWKIVVPEDEKSLEELFKGIDQKDVEYVRRGIERFIKYRVGNFKKLEGLGEKKEDQRFKLKVGLRGRRFNVFFAIEDIQDDYGHKKSVLVPVNIEHRNNDCKDNFAKI